MLERLAAVGAVVDVDHVDDPRRLRHPQVGDERFVDARAVSGLVVAGVLERLVGGDQVPVEDEVRVSERSVRADGQRRGVEVERLTHEGVAVRVPSQPHDGLVELGGAEAGLLAELDRTDARLLAEQNHSYPLGCLEARAPQSVSAAVLRQLYSIIINH